MSNETFFTTQWTRVIAAKGSSESSREALGDLCQSYYSPVVAFLRKEGRTDDAARDLAHGFFAWLLSRDAFATLQPRQSRFRSYLLGALKHFLSHQREKSSAQKRGAHITHLSMQSETETSPALDPADISSLPPDREFDRQWALHLIREALNSLEVEWDEAGKVPDFSQLRPFLDGNAPHGAMAKLASEISVSEGTLRSTISRLRAQFREHLKTAITPTVDSTEDVSTELQILLEALSG